MLPTQVKSVLEMNGSATERRLKRFERSHGPDAKLHI